MSAAGAPVRLAVSTSCPTCGGPLDFDEASNATRCDHCGSNLLVTGRGQVLSYFVRPRVPAAEALALAGHATARAPGRAGPTPARLYFVPYYRLTGGELRWEDRRVRPPVLSELPDEAHSLVGKLALGYGRWSSGSSATELEVADRHVEKSFLACDAPGLGVYSLGIRPGVLRLELFHAETLAALGKIVRVDLSAAAAVERGIKSPGDGEVRHREVVERVLSLVYFPFWVVEAGRPGGSLTVVDGVSRTVVVRDAGEALRQSLERDPEPEPAVLGFRALACPNCGWDLPVRPDDVIFHCGACERAWQIVSDRLDPVRFEVAGSPGTVAAHLPVWILGAEAERRWFAPAFRCRRRTFLNTLATSLLRRQPRYLPWEGPMPALHGCALDLEDARRVIRFALAGLRLQQTRGYVDGAEEAAVEGLAAEAARLAWLPFEGYAYALREAATRTAVPRRAVG